MNSVILDLLVLLAYFGVIIGIGVSQRSKSDSVEGFTLGDRQIAWWAVLASIMAAEISAATFLGAPESGFLKRNWTYAQFSIGTILARIIVSFLFIPLFYRQGVISLYEFLETRFGPITRKYASITFLITRVLAMGTRLYISAIILVLAWEMFFGMPSDPHAQAQLKFWLFTGAVVLVTGLTAIYTAVGGIRAVIWTDFIQVAVLISALTFSIYFLLSKTSGGWSTAQSFISDPKFFDFAQPPEPGFWPWVKNVLTSEYTIWAAVIGSTFVTMATHGIDQDTVQRMLTARNRRESAKATILSGLVDLPVVSAFILVGILLYAYYQMNPDPGLPKQANGEILAREVFPYFILNVMPAGMRGLVTAGILATAMGSLSTALNALATSFSRDFALPHLERNGILVDEWQRVRVLRQSTILFAGLIILVGVATAYLVALKPTPIIPLVLGILGFTFGSLLGVFLLGIFTKRRGNDFGNVIAMSAAVVAVIFLSNESIQRAMGIETPFVIEFPWRITLGTSVTFLLGLCFSTPPERVAAREAADATNA